MVKNGWTEASGNGEQMHRRVKDERRKRGSCE